MQSTYEYVVQDDTDICHYIGSTELIYGMKCTILRGYTNNDPYYSVQHDVVQKIMGDYPKEDLVFLQVANPGCAFLEYADEANKLAISLTAYIRFLQFFEKDLATVVRKMEFDTNKMTKGQDWMRFSDTILIRRSADKLFKKVLDVGNSFILYLCVLKDQQNIHLSLVYNDESMGQLSLPTVTCSKLALDVKALINMMGYKDTRALKRSPQSSTSISRGQKSEKKSPPKKRSSGTVVPSSQNGS